MIHRRRRATLYGRAISNSAGERVTRTNRAEEVTEVTTSIQRKRWATSVTKAFDRMGLAIGRPADGPRTPVPDLGSTDFKLVHKTRLTVAAALATAVGATALAVLSIARSDAGGAIVAVYAFVMAIAIAPVIVAEIRAQAHGPTRQTGATTRGSLKLVTAHAGEEVVIEETDDRLVVDASAGDLRVKLPQPSRVDHRMLTFERIDQTDRDVVLEPLGRSLEPADAELRLVVADGAWTTLDDS
jgi:hypothetical protein